MDPAKREPCGSMLAYSQHIRHGEKTDERCRAARRAYQNRWRAGRRNRARALADPTYGADLQLAAAGAASLDLDLEEIAQILRVTPRRARTLIAKGRERIRREREGR
jgi:hypothetical protein